MSIIYHSYNSMTKFIRTITKIIGFRKKEGVNKLMNTPTQPKSKIMTIET